MNVSVDIKYWNRCRNYESCFNGLLSDGRTCDGCNGKGYEVTEEGERLLEFLERVGIKNLLNNELSKEGIFIGHDRTHHKG